MTRFAGQPPMTEEAAQAGLAELCRQLEAEHPGLRFTVEPLPRDHPARRVGDGQVVGACAAPQDLDPVAVDRGRDAAARTGAADEHDVDHRPEDRGTLAA